MALGPDTEKPQYDLQYDTDCEEDSENRRVNHCLSDGLWGEGRETIEQGANEGQPEREHPESEEWLAHGCSMGFSMPGIYSSGREVVLVQ